MIAVDIVLLLPENIEKKTIKINNEFSDSTIRLEKERSIPHISLAMGCIKMKDIDELRNIVRKTLERFNPIRLLIDGIESWETPQGKNICGFSIARNASLQKLHEALMNEAQDILNHKATIDALYNSDTCDVETLHWINNYRKTSFEKFRPHITLGFGAAEYGKVNFVADMVAVCHLGNYCTCRKILYLDTLRHKIFKRLNKGLSNGRETNKG